MDFAAQEGAGSVRERILKLIKRHEAQGVYFETPFRDVPTEGQPVLARVDFGRWIADCECGGAEAVDLSEPIFYCFTCGNGDTGGAPRLVIFPKNMKDIEAELLKRPVIERRGRNEIERAFQAVPAVGQLSRSWTPDETLDDLKKQNAPLKEKKR